MRQVFATLAVLAALTSPLFAGEAEIRAAQKSIDGQLQAFKSGDNALAYSFAAPSIQKIFPSVDTFLGMVTRAYPPVYKPQSYAFGKTEEMGATIAQQVMLVGPDGKDYEALYTLELQPDGVYRITSVSLRASNALST